jgi:hypothetical protein
MWARVSDFSKLNTTSGITLYLYNTATGYYQWVTAVNATDYVKMNSGEWFPLIYNPSSMSAQGGAAAWGSPTEEINRIVIKAASGASGSGVYVDFSDVYFVRQRPKVLFAFDDANKTDLTGLDADLDKGAAKYLYDRGAAATTFIPHLNIDGGAGHLTVADIRSLRDDYGWSIGMHGPTAPPPTSDLAAEISWHRENGFPARHYAWPEGKFDIASRDYLLANGVVTARTTSTNSEAYSAKSDPLGLLFLVGNGTSAIANIGAFQTLLDTAIKYRGTLIVFTHLLNTGGGSGQTDLALWKTFVDYAVGRRNLGLCDIVTMDEWYDGLAGARLPASRLSA